MELYDSGKSTRDIAKILRMSRRDISFILKNGEVNHGLVIIDNGDKNNKSSNEKSTYLSNFESSLSVVALSGDNTY